MKRVMTVSGEGGGTAGFTFFSDPDLPVSSPWQLWISRGVLVVRLRWIEVGFYRAWRWRLALERPGDLCLRIGSRWMWYP